VTFVQKFKKYNSILSFVAPFSSNPKELAGFWVAGFKKASGIGNTKDILIGHQRIFLVHSYNND
jgi:hypothetical protein